MADNSGTLLAATLARPTFDTSVRLARTATPAARNAHGARSMLLMCVCLGVLGVAGCGSSDTNGAGGSGSTSTTGEQTSSSSTSSPAECVPSADHATVSPTCGLFVSSSLGTVDGTGTQDKPFATVTAALEAWDGRPIYVCGETVTEAETVKVATGDITLYGALNCAKEWVYDPTKKSKLVGAADKVSLAVAKDAGLKVSDFEVEAVDATLDGGSSVAVVAELGATLALTRCDVTAGAGKDGAAGEAYSDSAAAGTDGNPGTTACTAASVPGGDFVKNACDDADQTDDSIGGKGGSGDEVAGGNGSDGQPGATLNGGKGENNVDMCKDGTGGDPGADGTNATSGGKGLGELTTQGYQGADGAAGSKGGPGQGGGGGGGSKGGTGAGKCAVAGSAGGASGGSGGSGGCGGLGGKGGQAAGASLGLVSLGATLTLKEVSVTTAAGGNGGTGGDPQAGGFGGSGKPGGDNGGQANLKPGCPGGGGGTGGKGGLGGGGQGGHSLGLAYKGAAPDVKGVTFQIGTAGDGGKGTGSSNDAALHGDPGMACKTLSFDEGAASCVK